MDRKRARDGYTSKEVRGAFSSRPPPRWRRRLVISRFFLLELLLKRLRFSPVTADKKKATPTPVSSWRTTLCLHNLPNTTLQRELQHIKAESHNTFSSRAEPGTVWATEHLLKPNPCRPPSITNDGEQHERQACTWICYKPSILNQLFPPLSAPES